jgi:ACS family hexuronate transporter-like MFS transporter
MIKKSGVRNKWYMLGLAALTGTCCMAMPNMCMPVLFKEISNDLGLSLVDIGVVWGIAPLAGIITVFIGGLLADRYGSKRVLSIVCVLAGVVSALRGVSWDLTSLAATTFLFGFLTAIIPASTNKTVVVYFSGRQLGLAIGATAAGMAVGFTLSSMISATVLSPLLGGWRNVLFAYGALSALVGLLWVITVKEAGQPGSVTSFSRVPLRQSMSHVLRVKSVWLIGLIMLGHTGCVQGVLGYLPLYLTDYNSWTATSASGVLAAFHGFSALGAIPVAWLSDRLGLRKAVLFPILIITTVGVALLPMAGSVMVWVLAIMVGVVRDAFMALTSTTNIEAEGIGVMYSGTAVGLVQTISRIGPIFSPPVGNSLATTNNPGLPFYFWAAFAFLGLSILFFIKETGSRKSKVV